ncbi:hypothetical protein M0802_000552 [Mischocyttarus mexicanus]|nr:hypothetical protein M0802_000552 [Mischocyttarus mexicanus]
MIEPNRATLNRFKVGTVINSANSKEVREPVKVLRTWLNGGGSTSSSSSSSRSSSSDSADADAGSTTTTGDGGGG